MKTLPINSPKKFRVLVRNLFVIVLAVGSFQNNMAQEIYSKAYGNSKDKPILFLHGGPGYNSAGFEVTTAQALASSGFYVILYDRRGEGRSLDAKAQFNFKETFADMNTILDRYNLKKVTLIGHSFGGIVGTLYMKQFPEKVQALFLIGAPVSLQETFKTIIRSCRKIYEAKNDKTNLSYIEMLEKMDTTSAEYYAYSFGHAMQNGFYTPKKMSEDAKKIYSNAAKDPAFNYVSKMTIEAPQGFLKNENYTSIDLTNDLKSMVANHYKIYGMYGKDDGLYSVEQVNQVRELLGNDKVEYIDDCSHNVFIDQQKHFIDYIQSNSN